MISDVSADRALDPVVIYIRFLVSSMPTNATSTTGPTTAPVSLLGPPRPDNT